MKNLKQMIPDDSLINDSVGSIDSVSESSHNKHNTCKNSFLGGFQRSK